MLNKIKKLLGTGNIVVTGPPGSGKTQALIELINYLVGDGGVAPHRVLVFCFNRKWAKIIREETALAAPKSHTEIPINTFHSFCLDFLEDYHSRILLEHLHDSTRPQEFNTDINLLNSTQQWALLSEVMAGLDKKNYAISINYLNKNKFIANSYTQEVFDFILRAQESLLEPRKILDKFNPYYSKALSEIGGIYLKYLNELNSRNAYNYGLLLQHTAEILQKEEEVRKEYRQKYDFIIFDELQESNPAQLTIADLISGENCIFFGNDDQAVFSFRGSMSQNFRRVYDRTDKKNIITGKRNYRNSRDINELSQHFITLNSYRLDKESISRGGRGRVQIKDFHHMLDEAQFICEKIKELKNKKIPLEQVAVIIKGLGYETHIIENALDQNGIPFSRRGSRTILDNATVRYLLNVLRLFGRPYKQTEELDYLVENILLSSVLDINPLYFKEIKKRYESNKQEYEHIIDFLREDKNYEKKEKINQFLACLNKFEKLQQVPVFDFLLELIQDQYLGLWDKTSLDWEPISDFLSSVKSFNEDNSSAATEHYLDFLDQVIESRFIEEIEQSISASPEGRVNVLSFHQCKGLEFRAVFIPFLNEGYIPATLYLPQSYDLQLFGYLQKGDKPTASQLKKRHTEDERRLLYTGMTRARDYLYITSSKARPYSAFYLDLKKIARDIEIDTVDHEPGFAMDKMNCWQIKRRALVLAYRRDKGLHYSRYKLKKYINFLNKWWPPPGWWENIEVTANSNHPFQVFRPSFSYSALDAYRQCPLRYKYDYFFRIETGFNLAMQIGSLYHLIIQSFFQQKKFTWKRLKSIVEELFEAEDFEFKAVKKDALDRALADFENFYCNLMPTFPEQSVNEKPFRFKLNNYTIKGKVDQINFITDNEIELIDYKSSSKNYSRNDLQDEIQLKIYRMALDRSPDFEHLEASRVKLKYICLSNEKKPVAEMPGHYYKEQELVALIEDIIDHIKQEEFGPTRDYFNCSNCDYKIFCEEYYG